METSCPGAASIMASWSVQRFTETTRLETAAVPAAGLDAGASAPARFSPADTGGADVST